MYGKIEMNRNISLSEITEAIGWNERSGNLIKNKKKWRERGGMSKYCNTERCDEKIIRDEIIGNP